MTGLERSWKDSKGLGRNWEYLKGLGKDLKNLKELDRIERSARCGKVWLKTDRVTDNASSREACASKNRKFCAQYQLMT